MISTPYIFLAMVALCLISATHAFTSSKIGPIRSRPFASLTSSCAYLDGLYYEPSFHLSQRPTAEVWELGLLRDESREHPQEYISKCLVKLVGLSEYDAYLTVRKACQNGVSLIEEFPLEIAEFYHEELMKLGVLCEIVPVEE
ncbi:hypothetical protein HJC23_013955 [Cyclotella cryptica]|uniref:Adaptor protein ClpS core domain-containing protein n=1 Tax=Cyclotella cryptica TaxID=29204 RepID=A0ABD3Q3B5_9STRA|eukprot:CCRYP_009197-RA/>CCRYP_009197-RA protein AED:0.65 eAED:0.46 QI:0/-1/0/1/-1/1/1/0/142